MHDDTDLRAARANHTNRALDEMFGNVDDPNSAREATKNAADAVKTAKGSRPAARTKGPGLFSRIGAAFKSFGAKIAGAFRGEAAFNPADHIAPATAVADRSDDELKTGDAAQQDRLNVTLTPQQAREAAQALEKGQRQNLNVTMTAQEARAAASGVANGAQTAARRTAMDVAKQISDEHKDGHEAPGLGH